MMKYTTNLTSTNELTQEQLSVIKEWTSEEDVLRIGNIFNLDHSPVSLLELACTRKNAQEKLSAMILSKKKAI
ncbi:MAG: hypothetical protein PHY93_18540 [Bacteriovorax sp.]|nr:hypothetical protein [Bacteriovorax sp.]